MGNQTNLMLSYLLSAIEPLIHLFSLVSLPEGFCWKLCPLWSWSCFDTVPLFFGLQRRTLPRGRGMVWIILWVIPICLLIGDICQITLLRMNNWTGSVCDSFMMLGIKVRWFRMQPQIIWEHSLSAACHTAIMVHGCLYQPLLGLLDVSMLKRGPKQQTCVSRADMLLTCRPTCWQQDQKTVGRGTANVRPTCNLLTCWHHVSNMLAAKAAAIDYGGVSCKNATQQSNSKWTRGERHWQWHTTIK